MYLCVHEHRYIDVALIYITIHICISIYLYIYTYVRMYVYLYICIYTYLHICIHTYTHCTRCTFSCSCKLLDTATVPWATMAIATVPLYLMDPCLPAGLLKNMVHDWNPVHHKRERIHLHPSLASTVLGIWPCTCIDWTQVPPHIWVPVSCVHGFMSSYLTLCIGLFGLAH